MSRFWKVFNFLFQLPYLLLSLFLLMYFFPIFFQKQVFYYGDILMLLPLKKFFFSSITSGTFPLWLPHIQSGYPLFADISAGNYYLPYFLLIFSQTMNAVSLLIVLHFFVSAFFMYKLGKLYNLSNIGALAGSITFSFSGLLINYIAEPSRFIVVCLYPLFFFSLFKTFKNKNIAWLLITSLVLSFQIFAGHIQYVFIEILFTPFFLLQKQDKKIKDRSFSLLIVIILGLILSSVSLIPAIELIPRITRADISQNFSIYQSFSLHPLALMRFFLAHFWGIKNEGSAWGIMDTSTIGYIGFLPLIMIILNLKKFITNRLTLSLIVAAITSLIISFGTYLPFFNLFINIIPIFKIFRNPMAFLASYTFFASLLTGFAIDWLDLKKNIRLLASSFFIMALLATLSFFIISVNKHFPYDFLVMVAGMIHKKLSLFHTIEVDFAITGFILLNLIIICLLVSFGFFLRRKEILVVFIFLDLMIFTRSNFFTIDAQLLEQKNPIADYLTENVGSYRYISSSQIAPYSGMYDFFGSIVFQPPFSKEGVKLDRLTFEKKFLHELVLIPPNFSMSYNLHTIDGVSFILKNYNDLFKRPGQLNELYQKASVYNPYIKEISADTTLTKVDFSQISFNDEILDDLAVKYIVTDRNLYLSHHKKVFSSNGITVYLNENVKPRIPILNAGNKMIGEGQIIKETANTVAIKVDKKGTLILSDIYYPGWKAYIGSREVEIKPFADIFRQVPVDKEDVVVFRLQPYSFYYGLAITVITYVLVFLYLFKLSLSKQ